MGDAASQRMQRRRILIRVLFWIPGIIVAALVGQYAIEIAEDKGAFDNAGQRWDAAVSSVVEFLRPILGILTSPIAVNIAVFAFGAAVGLMIEWRYFRRPTSDSIENDNHNPETSAKLEPDISLAEIGARVERTMPPRPAAGKPLTNHLVNLNLKIADKVVGRGLSVWGRIGQAAIRPLNESTLRKAIFDARRDQIRSPGGGSFIAFDDVQLSRAQVDEIWPPTEVPSKLQPPARVEEWMPLHQALHYLVYDSLWARGQHRPGTKDAFDQAVSAEFRERLARGEIRARGAKGVAFSDDGKPTEEIPVTYWVDGFVLPHGVIALSDVSHDVVGNPSEGHTYRRVIVHRSDMMSAWPPSGMPGLSPLSAFIEPLRSKIAAEAKDISREAAILPDITLGEVIERILEIRGIEDDGSVEALEKIREIGREIGDQMSLRKLSTWGRREGTLEPLSFEISKRGFGIGRNAAGKVTHMQQCRADDGKVRNVTDFRFLKAEIDEVWPCQG